LALKNYYYSKYATWYGQYGRARDDASERRPRFDSFYAPDELHTIYISCIAGASEMNDFNVNSANQFNITIKKTLSASEAIVLGINSSVIWPGATIYTDQQVYVRDINNNQALA